MIPHVTNEIKRRIGRLAAQPRRMCLIVEIGGTVGDIEGLPFLEAIRQMRKDVGRKNTLYVHVTWLPYLAATKELKTKPTQHSVRELRGIGISPMSSCCAATRRWTTMCWPRWRSSATWTRKQSSRWLPPTPSTAVPLSLEDAGLGDWIVSQLGLTERAFGPGWAGGLAAVCQQAPLREAGPAHRPRRQVCRAGGRLSQRQGSADPCRRWPWAGISILPGSAPKSWRRAATDNRLAGVDGIVVPGGFGYRGIEGKIGAAHYAREHKVPYLGLCLGMQVMCIEFARHILQTMSRTAPSSTSAPSTRSSI